MAVIIKPLSAIDSKKQEAFIQIGRHRHRIASDHHRMLSDIQSTVIYAKMENLLFITSYLGAWLVWFSIRLLGSNLLWFVCKVTERFVEKSSQPDHQG